MSRDPQRGFLKSVTTEDSMVGENFRKWVGRRRKNSKKQEDEQFWEAHEGLFTVGVVIHKVLA